MDVYCIGGGVLERGRGAKVKWEASSKRGCVPCPRDPSGGVVCRGTAEAWEWDQDLDGKAGLIR